jgi:hypothetical protein
MPAGGNAGSGPPVSAAAIWEQSGWWPTTTTVSPRSSAAARTASAVAPGASRSSGSASSRGRASFLSGLAGAQERAGEHRVGPHAAVGEPLAERARDLATLGGQRPQLVGLTVRSFRVTYEVELHRREPTRGRRGAACRRSRRTGG